MATTDTITDRMSPWLSHDSTLYYIKLKDAERGRVYLVRETEFIPELIVCHPDDLEEIRKGLSRPLVDLRKWKGKKIPRRRYE